MARGPFWADGPPKENGPGREPGAASHKECGPRSDTSGCGSVESTRAGGTIGGNVVAFPVARNGAGGVA